MGNAAGNVFYAIREGSETVFGSLGWREAVGVRSRHLGKRSVIVYSFLLL